MHLPSQRLAGGRGFPSLALTPLGISFLILFLVCFLSVLPINPFMSAHRLAFCLFFSILVSGFHIFPSCCGLFSSCLLATLNVCFQKGMHRSEPGVPQFPALFLSTSCMAKAGWFAFLFFPFFLPSPRQLYNFLHGFIALKETEILPSDLEDLTSGLLFLSTQGTVFKFYGVWGLILDTRHLLWLRKSLGK